MTQPCGPRSIAAPPAARPRQHHPGAGGRRRLVAAATGIVLAGGNNAEPYILAFLAVLATVGVFSLFALACGILRVSAATTPIP